VIESGDFFSKFVLVILMHSNMLVQLISMVLPTQEEQKVTGFECDTTYDLVQKVFLISGHARRQWPMYFPIRRSLPVRPEPDNTFGTDRTILRCRAGDLTT